MRPWFRLVVSLCALAALSCATLTAEPAFVQPSRSLPLQTVISNAYDNGNVRVAETVWLEPYTVSSAGGLPGIRGELDKLGPVSEAAGRRFDGLTTWGLRWGFNFDTSNGACRLRNANIEIEAVITLPQVDGEGSLSQREADSWQAYLVQLRAHEDGHVNIYRAGAQELSNEILAVGEKPDCQQLRQALAALGEAKIARIVQADRYFDLETGHGAIFPAQE